MANIDYPRMMFHRTKEPVTVHSREQEDALGRDWSRIIWQAEAATPEPNARGEHAEPKSETVRHPEPETPTSRPEPEEEALPAPPPHRPTRIPIQPPDHPAKPAKTAKKRR